MDWHIGACSEVMPAPHREGRERRVGRERLRRPLGAAVHRIGGWAEAGVRVGEAQLVVDLIEDEDELRSRTGKRQWVSANPTHYP